MKSGRRGNGQSSDAVRASSVAGAVVKFVLSGFVVVVVFLAGSLFVLPQLGRSEAIREAREFSRIAGQGIVEPTLGNGVLVGDEASIERLDRVVQEHVLNERVVRVKIWTRDGRIVYSDEPRQIGTVHPLGKGERQALESGTTRVEVSDLSGPENRFEQGQGELYEVYLPIRTPDGTPLLFETYQRSSSLGSTGRRIWLPFAVLLLASLVLLWLVQVPLAWRLAARLRRSQLEREALLVKAIEGSADERRRIAAELHDGVVQDLAGVSFSLSAAVDRSHTEGEPDIRTTLREAASATRESMRRLRALLVDIHPPNLQLAGLEPALADLLAPLSARGIDVRLELPEDMKLSREAELMLYRAAGEAIRNVERHADARHVSVRMSQENGATRLEVDDDGHGFTPVERDRRRAAGHVGLSLLEELAERMGGRLNIEAAPGNGTSFVLEVPST